jgi:hypothetical protein
MPPFLYENTTLKLLHVKVKRWYNIMKKKEAVIYKYFFLRKKIIFILVIIYYLSNFLCNLLPIYMPMNKNSIHTPAHKQEKNILSIIYYFF